MLIFFFFFASALSALHLYNEPKFMVIGNPVILEQSHAHDAPDLWDRGSTTTLFLDGFGCGMYYNVFVC